MKCLILAAGYATRLYPLTENFPKPLLKVGEKAIVDWLIDDIAESGAVDEFIVISNHKFAHCFTDWAAQREGNLKISIIDDGTESNETRLGAVKDIQYAIEQCCIDDDMLVIAGDNVLDFSLQRFINYALEMHTSCIMRYFEEETIRLLVHGLAHLSGYDHERSEEEAIEMRALESKILDGLGVKIEL